MTMKYRLDRRAALGLLGGSKRAGDRDATAVAPPGRLALAVGVTVPALIGAPESTTREVLWEAYLGAENVAKVLRTVEDVYWETVRGVRDKARQDDELRSRVQERRDKYLAIRSEDLRRQAMRDGDDVSTPEAWAAYTKFWGLDAIPAIRAATDVLEGLESADDTVGGEG